MSPLFVVLAVVVFVLVIAGIFAAVVVVFFSTLVFNSKRCHQKGPLSCVSQTVSGEALKRRREQ